MTDGEMSREAAPVPVFAEPVTAAFIASSVVTTMLFVMTEHFAEAVAAVVAYSVAWLLVRP